MMSQENVELVRTIIPPPELDLAAIVRNDELFAATAAALGHLVAADIECAAVWAGGKTFEGIEGFRQMWLDWLEPWETYHSEVDEMIDRGDRVLVLGRDRGRRRGMDLEVPLTSGSIWEVRDGLLARVEFFRDRDEAVAAAGLTASDTSGTDPG